MFKATQTSSVRCGIETDGEHGAVVPPIYLSTNFTFAGYGQPRAYDYTRSGNPTRDQLAVALTDLEGGSGAVVTSSGMSAVLLAVQLLKAGEGLLVAHDCYGGCHRLFTALARRDGLGVQYIDFTVPSSLQQIRRERPRMVWLETPSNPLLRITDIAAVSEACKDVGALLVVDNTFLSPALQRPIELGADLVVHSTTKYLNGHSDVVGGAVVAADQSVAKDLAWWANCLGLTGAPFDSYLTLRGIRTLHVRMAEHQRNAESVAAALNAHEAVSQVYYPGLSDHPGHALARRQQAGFGAMISFELAGGEPAVRVFLESLRLFSLAESLGGVESLVAHPASMTHAAMEPDARAAAGIGDNLIRLSVGIEETQDLLTDLEGALNASLAVTTPTPQALAGNG